MSKGIIFIIGMVFGMLSGDIITTETIKRFGGVDTYNGEYLCTNKKSPLDQ